jgi:hypothetical protein
MEFERTRAGASRRRSVSMTLGRRDVVWTGGGHSDPLDRESRAAQYGEVIASLPPAMGEPWLPR